jgi:ElaB/YqjD/DUF883 family membrane-anchored ribosome-binding protein
MATELTSSYQSNASAKEQLLADIQNVVTDAGKLLQDVGNTTSEGFAAARSKMEASLEGAKSKFDNARSIATEKAKLAANTTDDYVKQCPWRAVGIATAAGLITGILVSRR